MMMLYDDGMKMVADWWRHRSAMKSADALGAALASENHCGIQMRFFDIHEDDALVKARRDDICMALFALLQSDDAGSQTPEPRSGQSSPMANMFAEILEHDRIVQRHQMSRTMRIRMTCRAICAFLYVRAKPKHVIVYTPSQNLFH
jgi:hypothetical protein